MQRRRYLSDARQKDKRDQKGNERGIQRANAPEPAAQKEYDDGKSYDRRKWRIVRDERIQTRKHPGTGKKGDGKQQNIDRLTAPAEECAHRAIASAVFFSER